MTDAHPMKMRRCGERGCETVLSRYNFGDFCYTHRKPEFVSHRVKEDKTGVVVRRFIRGER